MNGGPVKQVATQQKTVAQTTAPAQPQQTQPQSTPQQPPPANPAVAALDPNKIIPVNVSRQTTREEKVDCKLQETIQHYR